MLPIPGSSGTLAVLLVCEILRKRPLSQKSKSTITNIERLILLLAFLFVALALDSFYFIPIIQLLNINIVWLA
jgi:hypothetical protein